MRVGFIGTGGFAERHAEALRQLGATVSACYSTNRPKAQAFAETFGGRVFDQPLDLIDRAHIDVLYLVSPPHAHDGTAELATVKAGIPFLVEKPVGLDLGVCRRVAEAVKAKKLVTCVGYLLRESSLLPEIRSVLARNQISSVRSCRMNGFPQVHWWRKMATSGGMMVEQATHMVDLLRHVIGEIRTVSAATASGISRERWEGCDVYDSMETLMTFKRGVIGSIGVSNVLTAGFTKVEVLEAFGRDFHLILTFEGLRYREGQGEWVEKRTRMLDGALEAENRRFLAAAARGDPSDVTCSYEDGVRTLAATLAMNEAAATGRVITLED